MFLAEGPRSSGWFHILLNFIGPDSGMGIRVYHNGKQAGSGTIKSSQKLTNADGRIVIGRQYTNNNFRLGSNQVDELYFFNQPLTEDEIKMLNTFSAN